MKGRGAWVVGVLATIVVLLTLVTVVRPWGSGEGSVRVMDRSGRVAPNVRIRTEVLNASEVSGLASNATGYLRELGFDVVNYGNAPEVTGDSSRVFDRVGDMQMARAVANAMGIRNVLSEPDPNLFVDVSVWLGSEWVAPEVTPVAAEGARSWWDPRGWFR